MSFGIDFGTTNCAVVYNGATVFDTDGDQPFPSIVAVNAYAPDEVIVGPEAKAKRLGLEDQDFVVIPSVKRHLLDDEPRTIGGRQWTSVDVAAELFRSLRKLVASRPAVRRAMDSAVVSIPVGFRPEARRRLREAARRGGVEVEAFVHEPTAAYFRCRDDLPEAARLAVFDWGGGTLDVSVLDVRGEEVREVATAGMERAGDAIDAALAEEIHRRALGDEVSLAQVRPELRDRLRARAEQAKIDLADQEATTVSMPYHGGLLSERIDRATLDAIAGPHVRAAVDKLRRALEEADRVAGEGRLELILPIGGTSKLASLRPYLERAFPDAVVHDVTRPQWATAQGASLLLQDRQLGGSGVGSDGGPYRLISPISLVQSDGTPMPLAVAGDPFDDAWRRHHVGVVEVTSHAQLVFAVPREGAGGELVEDDAAATLRPIGYLSVPLQGFHRERLRVETRLTRDLAMEVRVQSEAGRPDREGHWSHWDYGKLRFAYRLPQT